MCDALSEFVVNQYVHLPEFLDKDNCAELTAELKKLVVKKATTKDDQCPLSEAIHGAQVFDSLLVQLLPNFELASGKKLLPTYAYARLYAPGEELVNHRDRESCEISATVTLGFDGDVWPIYMGDSEDKTNASEIKMGVGDAVLYRGMDKWHWREKYTEGKWQAQVFLHYVDANGPHKEWIYDKRGKLNLPQDSKEVNQWIYTDIFTKDACDKLIATYDQEAVEKLPPVIGDGEGAINTDIRNVERIMLPVYKDIGGRLVAAGLSANNQAWKFNVTHANQAEFLKYPAGGRYTTHVDSFLDPTATECRKLTVLAFLNDDFEGGKFYFMQGHEKVYPHQEKGTVIVFPSFIPHGVEDITKGVRYSAVCWMVGPFFK
jgi:predicted 2-oxoglutarate/Fe(II)-dependent dioxygenase YbiX